MLISDTDDELDIRVWSRYVQLTAYNSASQEEAELLLTPEQARQAGKALIKAADAAEEE